MKRLGIFLVVTGLLWLLAALAMDTTVSTVSGRVHNIGLLAERSNHLFLGSLCTLVGALFAVFGRTRRSIGAAQRVDIASAAEMYDLKALLANKGKTGLVIDTNDGRTILGTSPGSPAETAGLLAGDRLITIDGELCQGDYKAIALRLAGAPGSFVKLSIRRGEQAQDLVLQRH